MIVAVVLTYAPPEGMLEACVDSVLAAGDVDRVVVVDNGTSATARLGARDVEVIVTGRNLGYAGGMNVGIRRAVDLGADAVLVLNDDLVVEPGAVAPLVAELAADAAVGAVQPKLLLPGDPVRVNSVGVELGRDGAGVDAGIGELDGPAFGATRDIDVFTGGAVLLRTEMLRDVGGFDERYFLYYEDVDLALRARERGWRSRCAPASRVVHTGGVSTLHADARPRTIYLRERNRLWILVRHRPVSHIARGTWLSIRRLRWPPRRTHARALAAGLAAAPRLLVARARAGRAQAGSARGVASARTRRPG